jgi:glutathione S-transferase
VNRLITFRPSHYCEKARWALDRGGIPYREESHVPVFSWLATFGARARRTVPALVTGDAVLPDSTDILRWVGLGMDDPEVAALEDDFDRRLGPATRRLAYFHVVDDRPLLERFLGQHGRPWEARATAVVYPLIRAIIVRGLKIGPEGAARSRRALDEVLARVADRLSDGRRYLCGDRFTAADLTFAALVYPVIWPDAAVTRGIAEPFAALPAGLQALIVEIRDTPAGRFGLRLWESERSPGGR